MGETIQANERPTESKQNAMSNATPSDKAPVAQTEGERPSCSTCKGDADRTFSLDCSDVTGGDVNAPRLDEGTQLGLELSRKERQKVEDETRKRQRFLRKMAQGKEMGNESRGESKEAKRLEGLVQAGFLHSKAQELLQDKKCDVRIIYRPRCPERATFMNGQQYAPNDPIFCDCKPLGRRGSGSFYILDEDTHEIVAAIKITEVKDLTPKSKAKFQHIFSDFTRDKGFHPSVANNNAMVGGGMGASGWHASMEQGQAFGTYVPYTSVDPSIWYNHTEGGKEIHRMFAESFRDMARGLFENQQMECHDYSVPALGVDFQNDKKNHPYIFCSNLAYTYSKFEFPVSSLQCLMLGI